mgnify:CR=1 FL=1
MHKLDEELDALKVEPPWAYLGRCAEVRFSYDKVVLLALGPAEINGIRFLEADGGRGGRPLAPAATAAARAPDGSVIDALLIPRL